MKLNKRAKLQIGLLLLPGVLIFGTFTVYPILRLLFMSFFQWDFGSFFDQSFIALENYQAVLSDKHFYTAFGNTVAYTFVTVPAQMLFGFIVALMIHSAAKGKIFFRVAYYLPVITSWVIASLVFKYIFNTEGLLNYVLTSVFHLTRQNIHWLDTRWGGNGGGYAAGHLERGWLEYGCFSGRPAYRPQRTLRGGRIRRGVRLVQLLERDTAGN